MFLVILAITASALAWYTLLALCPSYHNLHCFSGARTIASPSLH